MEGLFLTAAYDFAILSCAWPAPLSYAGVYRDMKWSGFVGQLLPIGRCLKTGSGSLRCWVGLSYSFPHPRENLWRRLQTFPLCAQLPVLAG